MIEIRAFRDLVRLFFIFKREFKLAFLVTVIAAALGAFLLPSRYLSEARLLVKPGRETATLPIEYQDRQALIAPSTQRDPIVDEEKMLTGRPIARAVVDYYLAHVESRPPKGFWKTIKYGIKKTLNWSVETLRSGLVLINVVEDQSPAERLAAKFEKAFEVTHAPGSSVMEISFTWGDPAEAQAIVDKWISIYLDERTQALGRKSLYEFYENESQRLAAEIAEDKATISRYLQDIDGLNSSEKLESLSARINKVTEERAEARAEQLALEGGISRAGQWSRELPSEVMKERELSLNPVQQDLKLKLNGLELERLDKLKIYREDSAPIKDLDAAIAAMKVAIASEKDTVQRSENRVPNELVIMLKRGSLERDMRANELSAHIKAYDQELESLKGERNRVLSIDPELSRLERDLTAAEKNYALYRDSLEKARIDQELDNSRISNIAIIEQATFSPSRVFPKSLLILLMAIPAGIAVGLFTIYLCYLLDQRIHDGGRLEVRFGVRVWSTVLEVDPKGPLNLAFEASLYRLYSLLPLDRIQESGLTIGLSSARGAEGVSFIAEKVLHILQDRKIDARLAKDEFDRAAAGEVVILMASSLVDNHSAFVQLKQADLILLVIEARKSTVPVVENALGILKTAFGKVDGLVLNRRRYEIPDSLLARINRLKGEA
jgi:polysaccharide biosynthesis protein PslE